MDSLRNRRRLAKESVLRNAFDATEFYEKKSDREPCRRIIIWKKSSNPETPVFFLSFLFHAVFKHFYIKA